MTMGLPGLSLVLVGILNLGGVLPTAFLALMSRA